ncbi:MAG: GGDEF domain-containing protein [Pseudobutyrivibrio sp.]|nr:GGDEF domain-containing protein [Pseudobutyrivibrio sp.]
MVIKDKKINKIIRWANILVLGVTVFAMVVCYFSTRYKSSPQITQQIEPITVAILEDGSKEYFLDLRDFDYHYSGVMFYTSHQKVTAYNAGHEIYSFDRTGGFWTSSTGSGYHFIDINSRMVQIAIIVKPIYEEVADQQLTFYVGSAYGMYNEVMIDSMPRFFASLLILFLSIAIFGYYEFMHTKLQLDNKLLFLSGFTFFCGLWSINETDASALLISNKIFDSLIPFLSLMLVVPPFILFFDSYLELRSTLIKHILVIASMCQFIILTFLHFTKIAEYRQTLVCMQITLLVSAGYMVGGMIVQFFRRRNTRQIEICAVGLSLFLLALVVDITMYYRSLGDADKIGRYLFLVFAFTLAWDMIKDANEILEKGRRAKQLEVFALTDSMTGLLNRNAFEKHAGSDEKLDGLVAVVADANGLKKCNDTYGHEAGDEYISIVAELFNKVYGKYGNCYRIGGDEFCCIISQGNRVNLDVLRNLFLAKIHHANEDGDYIFDIAVAIGDASYDAEQDEDFRSIVKRADSYMYENKRRYKEA